MNDEYRCKCTIYISVHCCVFYFDLLPPSFFHSFMIVRLLESTSLFDKGIGIALVLRLEGGRRKLRGV